MSNPTENIESHKPGIIERLGKKELRDYFLYLTVAFAGIGLADVAANIILPALHAIENLNTLDRAPIIGAISGGFGAISGGFEISRRLDTKRNMG